MFERFEELRVAKGVSMSEVARAIGVSKSTLSMWKAGKSTPKTSTIQKLADYFDISIDTFVGKTDRSSTISEKAMRCAELLSQLPEEWQDEYMRRFTRDIDFLKK